MYFIVNAYYKFSWALLADLNLNLSDILKLLTIGNSFVKYLINYECEIYRNQVSLVSV